MADKFPRIGHPPPLEQVSRDLILERQALASIVSELSTAEDAADRASLAAKIARKRKVIASFEADVARLSGAADANR